MQRVVRRMAVLEGRKFTKNLERQLDSPRAIAGPTAMWRADGPRVDLEVQLGCGTTDSRYSAPWRAVAVNSSQRRV